MIFSGAQVLSEVMLRRLGEKLAASAMRCHLRRLMEELRVEVSLLMQSRNPRLQPLADKG